MIPNQSNKGSNCCTYINQSYENEKYQANDKISYNRFNGNDSSIFSIDEWEVWKIDYKSYKKKEEGKKWCINKDKPKVKEWLDKYI